MKEINTFLGTGWSFPPSFSDADYSVEMVADEKDIYQSLKLLLTTFPGERMTNPEYGCDLRSIIFNNINSSTNYRIKEIIKLAVLRYESRITLDDVILDNSEEDEGRVTIKLEYTIRKVNIRSNAVFPFYKVEGTNIVEV